ncbi:uncharacterized protein LOC133889497 [Phragmites australis]|uniref:uncharacterized protein LOC133889497 n=1 Tax=Phragmites australis TaxID=29695 RepID=UPI002D773734|nr:uncharacterized protein LOC133889497 [Phragmites australis]
MEMEMESERERETEAGRKSDYKGKGDGEDEAAKRRKIDPDGGVAEWQRRMDEIVDDLDAEKMAVEELLREREAVKKRDRKGEEEGEAAKIDSYAEEREVRAAVLFAEWQKTVEKKENDKGEGECEAAKIDPDAESQRRMEGKEDDSNNVEMEMEVEVEVEELFREREAVKKREQEEDEAAKNIKHKGAREAGKIDQKGECEAGNIDAGAEERKRRLEEFAQWRRRKEAEEVAPDPEKLTDFYAFQARSFEQRWNEHYANWVYGSFHDKTEIPCMRFTFKPAPDGGKQPSTLQIFSVKVAEISGGLQWPLNVFGMVALRDSVDQNRNMIFDRDRDNCQTLTEKDPYLILTGPVRAVVLSCRVVFEVSLNVRGTIESEDKEISLLAVPFRSNSWPFDSILINEHYTSRLTTLEFSLGHIVYSVEATISVQVIYGSWPDGFRGQFAARTASIGKEVVLLDSGDEKLPVAGDEIKLSRRVTSVESYGKLVVSVKALQGDKVFSDEKDFTPQEMGTSFEMLEIGACRMKATVAWSLFSGHPKLMRTR